VEYRYQSNDEIVVVRVEKSGAEYTLTVGGQTFTARAAMTQPGELSLTLNGVRRTAFFAADGLRRWVAFDSQPVVLTIPQTAKNPTRERHGRPAHESLEAQMPGMIRKVLAGVGERVEKGQSLVLMEAMKMEIRVTAPHAGVVEKILVSEGQAVERGQTLVELAGD
jgi:biotin carboxyl carrier protein